MSAHDERDERLVIVFSKKCTDAEDSKIDVVDSASTVDNMSSLIALQKKLFDVYKHIVQSGADKNVFRCMLSQAENVSQRGRAKVWLAFVDT